MGSSFKKFSPYFSKEDEARILMLGLDAAGKTTIIYQLKLGEVVTTIPTIGFNVETITAANVNITTWDVGGRCKIRPLWRHYYANTSGIVFVIDSNDRDRISDACDELHDMLKEEQLRNVPILIFANKQDLPNALALNEIKEKLNLSKLDQIQSKWYLQPSVATKSEGLEDGFRWLANTIQSKTDYTQPIIETINDSKTLKNDLLYNFKTLLSKFI
jgi:ADP-ribosylation factor protein 1